MAEMRDNLVFYGISETKDENCYAVLAQFFTDELGVTEEIDLARVHRMVKATPGKTRPIVAKFERYQQREKVRMAGPRLFDLLISIIFTCILFPGGLCDSDHIWS